MNTRKTTIVLAALSVKRMRRGNRVKTKCGTYVYLLIIITIDTCVRSHEYDQDVSSIYAK